MNMHIEIVVCASVNSELCGFSGLMQRTIHGMSYSALMGGLTKAGIEVDRKMLADLAVRQPQAFAELVDRSKQAS